MSQDIRSYINLLESSGLNELWIAPDLTIVVKHLSHSMSVANDPGMFGIDPDLVEKIVAPWRDEGEELDYEYLIALAEANGWVRVSYDAGDFTGRTVAMSGNLPRTVARALSHLLDEGHQITDLQVEIDQIRGSAIRTAYAHITGNDIERFAKLGNLRLGPWRDQGVTKFD